MRIGFRAFVLRLLPIVARPNEPPELPALMVAGTRVRVSSEDFWPKKAIGTISIAPRAVQELTGDWQGHYRVVQAVKGPLIFYWVQFDEPQLDDDGDGPFIAAEVEAAYLQPDSSRPGDQRSERDEYPQLAFVLNKKTGKKYGIRAYVSKKGPAER